VAGTWQKDKAPRSLLAIASDGVNWKIYRPILAAGAKPAPETVTLDELLEFKLSDESLGPFWLWLTSVLFRPQQIEPVAERFQLDFGTWSPLYRETMAALKRAWVKVNGESEAKLAFETWQKYLTVTYGRLTENTTAIKDEETAEEISELENLFLRHTYLASIARLLIWAALSKGKADATLPKLREMSSPDVISSRSAWPTSWMMISSTGFATLRRRIFLQADGKESCHISPNMIFPRSGKMCSKVSTSS
jgi:hypothetical protein